MSGGLDQPSPATWIATAPPVRRRSSGGRGGRDRLRAPEPAADEQWLQQQQRQRHYAANAATV